MRAASVYAWQDFLAELLYPSDFLSIGGCMLCYYVIYYYVTATKKMKMFNGGLV